ncbi:MAG: type I-E CRISPR-associated protein Cas7/Cse4/CasC [Blastocatellia bacterium]|nr:type I-E CRISPR-associated protein Cas7/Cse4/CasC [Blastocatellia bacterium]
MSDSDDGKGFLESRYGVRRAYAVIEAAPARARTFARLTGITTGSEGECRLLMQNSWGHKAGGIRLTEVGPNEMIEVGPIQVVKTKVEEEARRVVENILNGVKLTVKDDGKTQYLLFLGADEINAIAGLCLQHWEALVTITVATSNDEGAKKAKTKDAKKAGAEAIPPEIKKAMFEVLNGGKAADLALFGRMLADLPDRNVHAASQVAHAISTNKISMEFDLYTAVDDLRPDDNQGSDMLGTVEFNSACFYRYANVDIEQLKKNLGGDTELANTTIEAFIRSAVTTIPTGKQNSMAAQNPPSFVLAVVRDAGLWSLANAFVKPIRPNHESDLIENSIKALDGYWGDLTEMYGKEQIKGVWVASLALNGLANLKDAKGGNLKELIGGVMSALREQSQEGRQ